MSSSRRYQPGQSAIIFVFLIVVIVGMVGLAVDGGNAYAEQRRVQSATNAGALAAMQAAQAKNATNNDVWNSVQSTLYGNEVDVDGEAYSYRVDYVLSDGSVLLLGSWSEGTADVRSGSGKPPANIERVQVTMTETVPTYFASVVGQKSLSVAANGVSCVGTYGPGVYPLGVPRNLLKTNNGQPYHRIYQANGTLLPTTNADWGNWDKMQGMSIYLPVENWSSGMSGTHMAWLSWDGSNGANELKAALTYPGTLQNGYVEATPFDTTKPNSEPATQLTLGDWINGDTGVKATVQGELDTLKNSNRDLILPIYEQAGKVNGKTVFRIAKMGFFRLVNANMNGGAKYIQVQYLGEAATVPSECSSEAVTPPNTPGTSPTPAPERYNIDGTAEVNRVYREMVASKRYTNDIVLVMDTSGSMALDWNDQNTGASKARMVDAKRVLDQFLQYYDVSEQTGDPDARVSFVTFGGHGTSSSVVLQSNWTAASSWSQVRQKVNSMTANGGTPGPLAFESVQQLLANKRTPAQGKIYRQIVVFATDGVFNICGNTKGEQNCPVNQPVPLPPGVAETQANSDRYRNDPAYNMVSGRPVWQAQQVAQKIKAAGAQVFVVALTPTCLAGDTDCFNPAGLPEMSSGAGYYFAANDKQTLDSIYERVRDEIVDATCVPYEQQEVAPGAKVILTQPSNPTWKMQTTADGSGRFLFENLLAGQYVITVEPFKTASAEDGILRTYARIQNGRALSEEGQVLVELTAQLPDDATVTKEVLMSLTTNSDGTPNNACTVPAQ